MCQCTIPYIAGKIYVSVLKRFLRGNSNTTICRLKYVHPHCHVYIYMVATKLCNAVYRCNGGINLLVLVCSDIK